MTTAGIVADLPALAAELSRGTFALEPVAVALRDVETVWTRPERPGSRVVLVP